MAGAVRLRYRSRKSRFPKAPPIHLSFVVLQIAQLHMLAKEWNHRGISRRRRSLVAWRDLVEDSCTYIIKATVILQSLYGQIDRLSTEGNTGIALDALRRRKTMQGEIGERWKL